MFPTRGNYDYTNEMQRLFSKPENDNRNYNPNLSPFSQAVNRSSSSADSTSPESYMSTDIGPNTSMYSPLQSPRQDLFKMQVQNSPPSSLEYPSTPIVKRHRPIIGRQIMSSTERLPVNYESPVQASPMMKEDISNQHFWQRDDSVMLQQTPPNNRNYFIEKKRYQPNVFYELFPSENREFEFRTPVKTSPTLGCVSPSHTNMSLMTANSQNAYSPLTSQNFRPFNQNRSTSLIPNNPKFNQVIKQQKMCTFCRKNGETPVVYMTHTVKEKVDNKWVVTCPILRSHVCSICGVSGDDAHTITYCPVLRSRNNGLPLQSTTITLKNTRILSNGRRRY